MERPIPEHDPPINHVDLIGRMLVRGIRTAQKEFFGRGRRSSPSNQRDLVGHVQGSDARFLLNQSVSDLAFRDFVPITFQGNFFGVKMKKKKKLHHHHHLCIRPIGAKNSNASLQRVYGIPIGGQQGHSIVHGTRRRAGPSLVAEHLICSETFNGPLDVIYPPDFLLDSGGTASRRSYPDGYRTRVWSDTPRVPVMEYSRHLGPFHFCGQPLSGQLPSD